MLTAPPHDVSVGGVGCSPDFLVNVGDGDAAECRAVEVVRVWCGVLGGGFPVDEFEAVGCVNDVPGPHVSVVDVVFFEAQQQVSDLFERFVLRQFECRCASLDDDVGSAVV